LTEPGWSNGIISNQEDYRSARCAIAIMAKAPSAGRVKTRLSPLLDPQEAMDLGRCFLSDMIANLARVAQEAPVDPFIAFAPAGSEAAFDTIVAPGTGFVLADGSRAAPPGVVGLGLCLLQAAASLLDAGYGAVALLSADSPTLPTSLLLAAARLLLVPRDRVVIGPSFDGGYYLIGIRRAHAELFHAIDWSTEQVAEQTRQRALGLGLEVLDLDAWYDVDDARSLQRLVYELAPNQTVNATSVYPAPVTRAFLEQKALADRLATSGVAMMPAPADDSRPHSLRNLDAAKSSS
jgi:rSAM/selenodomain-associated transferase 1